MHRPSFLIALLGVALGCTSTPADGAVSAQELVSDPATYDGRFLEIVGAPTYDVWLTAAVCTDDRPAPCNQALGGYAYGDPDGHAIQLVPSESYTGPRAFGEVPGYCYDHLCREGTLLGCHGNEEQALCAPALPQRIERVFGTLRGDQLLVDAVVLQDGPTVDGMFREVD